MKPRSMMALACLVLLQSGCAESLEYEIYSLQGNSDRKLVAEGRVNSDDKNAQTFEYSAFGSVARRKFIPLSQGFWVGATTYREKSPHGFALWIRKEGGGAGSKMGGFSWNWFTLESGQIYQKLKGTGRVKVTLDPKNDGDEITAIEFLDDVTLTGSFGTFWFLSGTTHEVVIKKGSVLRLGS